MIYYDIRWNLNKTSSGVKRPLKVIYFVSPNELKYNLSTQISNLNTSNIMKPLFLTMVNYSLLKYYTEYSTMN